MDIWVVTDEKQNVIAAFDNEKAADDVANLVDMEGDADYCGHAPIRLELNPQVPPCGHPSRKCWRIHCNREGKAIESEWVVPLRRDSEGKLHASEVGMCFHSFTDPDYGPVLAVIFVIAEDEDEAEQMASKITANIVKSGLWPQEDASRLASEINSKCVPKDGA